MNKAQERLKEIDKAIREYDNLTISERIKIAVERGLITLLIAEKQGILLGIEETKKDLLDKVAMKDILYEHDQMILEKLNRVKSWRESGQDEGYDYYVRWADIEEVFK